MRFPTVGSPRNRSVSQGTAAALSGPANLPGSRHPLSDVSLIRCACSDVEPLDPEGPTAPKLEMLVAKDPLTAQLPLAGTGDSASDAAHRLAGPKPDPCDE
jgi:hypothetical protein